MGNKWEVYAFVRREGVWDYEMVWRGQRAVGAIWAATKAKRSGAGCVKVEWR